MSLHWAYYPMQALSWKIIIMTWAGVSDLWALVTPHEWKDSIISRFIDALPIYPHRITYFSSLWLELLYLSTLLHKHITIKEKENRCIETWERTHLASSRYTLSSQSSRQGSRGNVLTDINVSFSVGQLKCVTDFNE